MRIPGVFLRRRLRDAREEYHKQHETFVEFCEQQSDSAEQWKEEVRDWEAAPDGAKPKNPFESPHVGQYLHYVVLRETCCNNIQQEQPRTMSETSMHWMRPWPKSLVLFLFTTYLRVALSSLSWS